MSKENINLTIRPEDFDNSVSEILHYAIKGVFEESKTNGENNPMIAIERILSLSLKAGIITETLPDNLMKSFNNKHTHGDTAP